MPMDAPDVSAAAGAETETLVVQLAGREHRIDYRVGDTVLGAVRRAGLKGPFNCQQGNCGTCIARVEKGSAVMRANHVLDENEVADGWILTCQAVPTSREVTVVYEI